MLASGGMIALPSWTLGWKSGDMTTRNSTFTRTEQELIMALADTVIPSDGTIGALSVGVDKYLIRLIEECYEEDFRDNVKIQLQKLDVEAEKAERSSFIKCNQKQREDIFLVFSTSGKESEKEFFEFMKWQTIRGFNTSEEVMVNYHNYVMMPGYYDGCVDVEN